MTSVMISAVKTKSCLSISGPTIGRWIAGLGAIACMSLLFASASAAQTRTCPSLERRAFNNSITIPTAGGTRTERLSVRMQPGDVVSLRIARGGSFTDPGATAKFTLTRAPVNTPVTLIGEQNPPASGALRADYEAPRAGTYRFTYMMTAPNSDFPSTIDFRIACTVAPEEEQPETAETTIPEVIVRRFTFRRADLALADEPDRPRLARKLPGSLFGSVNGSAGGASRTTTAAGAMQLGRERTRISTSLHELARAASGLTNANKLGAGSTKDDLPSFNVPHRPPRFDVWVEGHYVSFNARADTDGHYGVIYTGADYLFHPALLLGVLAQFDTLDEKSDLLSYRAKGKGWMVGPYATLRLTPNLLWDARVAWGRTSNEVSPFLTYTSDFDTTRWLARTNLTGNWSLGRWRFSPSVAVAYLEDKQASFTTTGTGVVAQETVRLGRLQFGPEIGYVHTLRDGTTLEPHGKLEGIWHFAGRQTLTMNSIALEQDAFRGKASAGLIVTRPSGINLRGVVTYDGLGSDDFDAIGGEVWLNIPLN